MGDTGYGTVYGPQERAGRARRKNTQTQKVKRVFLHPGEKVEIRFQTKGADFWAFFRDAEALYKELCGGIIIPGHEWPLKEEKNA